MGLDPKKTIPINIYIISKNLLIFITKIEDTIKVLNSQVYYKFVNIK